jgi:hypothetical protein
MKKKRLFSLYLILLLGFLLTTVKAWTPLQRLTWTAGESLNPSVSIDSNDVIHILFQDATFGYPKYDIYHKATTDKGATWTPLNRLTWSSGDSTMPDAAVGPNDFLHMVWEDDFQGNQEIYYKQSQNSGSSWGGIKRLTWNPHSSSTPRIAVGGNGHIHVVWYEYTASYDNDIFYKKSTDNGVTWSKTQRLSWSNESSSPVIGIDSNGKIHIFFHERLTATTWATEIFHINSTDSGTTWSAKQRITWNTGIEWESNRTRSIAINADNIHVVWRYLYYRLVWSNKSNIYYKNSPDGGVTWGPTKKLTWTGMQMDPDPILIGSPSIAVDSLNNPHIAWDFYMSTYSGGDDEIIYNNSTNGGTTWGINQRLTWNYGDSNYTQIVIDSTNTPHMVWVDKSPGNSEIFYKKD